MPLYKSFLVCQFPYCPASGSLMHQATLLMPIFPQSYMRTIHKSKFQHVAKWSNLIYTQHLPAKTTSVVSRTR